MFGRIHEVLRLASMVLLPGLTGCASLQLYPVCQYAGAVDDASAARFSKSVGDILSNLDVDRDKRNAPVLLANRRYVAISTVSWKHSQLRAVWPDIGCLGQYGNAEDRAKYSACREYIAQVLGRNTPGAAEDTVLCFTREECSRRSRTPSRGDADALIYCNGTR